MIEDFGVRNASSTLLKEAVILRSETERKRRIATKNLLLGGGVEKNEKQILRSPSLRSGLPQNDKIEYSRGWVGSIFKFQS